MESTSRETLVAARLLALYVLSLLSASSADLAWRSPGPGRLVTHALTLGLALVFGSLLAEALSAVGAAGLRRRARLLALLFVPVPSVFALAVAWTAPRFADEAASALVLLQVAVLLLGEALGLELLALWCALVLALVAAAGGGLPGAVGLAAFLALAGVFFSLDHAVRRLAVWPHVPAPALGLVLQDALRMLAAPVLLLGIALLALPAPPPGPGELAPLTLAAPEVRRAYEWLILVALAGTGAMTLVFRWLRGRGSDTPPLVEMAETRIEAEELVEPPNVDHARYAPARGRVIRAYLRFLTRAREAGLRLGRHLTPREIGARVRRPEEALGVLTELFMDARYGPDEPDPEAIHRAEAASREVCATLRVLPRSARRRHPLPPDLMDGV